MKARVHLIPPLVGQTFDNLQTQVANTEFSFLQFSSVAQLCPTLCDPMDCSTPGFPVHHQLLELTQIYAHQVNDGIQTSRALSPPSPAFNLCQHQGLSQ